MFIFCIVFSRCSSVASQLKIKVDYPVQKDCCRALIGGMQRYLLRKILAFLVEEPAFPMAEAFTPYFAISSDNCWEVFSQKREGAVWTLQWFWMLDFTLVVKLEPKDKILLLLQIETWISNHSVCFLLTAVITEPISDTVCSSWRKLK